MRKLIVLDLDDTLINNVHDYAQPILDYIGIIVKALGSKAPHVSKIMAMGQEIDKRRVHEINPTTGKPFLYSMERFPGSCVETYREICDRVGVIPHPDIEAELHQVGMGAFDERHYRQNIKPRAKEVLEFLIEQGDTLVLLSKGDPWVQENKLRALKRAGIDCFSKVLIVDTKIPEMFREIREEFPDLTPISIGNSFKSDIAPALEVGYFGVHIPVETWEDLGHKTKIGWWRRLWERLSNLFPQKRKEEEQYIQLSSLREIITEYGRLP